MSKKKPEKKATAKLRRRFPSRKPSQAKPSTERHETKKTAKGKELTPTAATVPTKDAPTTAVAPPTPDPRLPAAGTLVQKRDSHGAVRCECMVEEGGVRYAGKVYRSLSSAAMTAAKDLGLTNKTQNGFVFWGLSKPPRRRGDPMVVLERAWARYHGKVEALLKESVTDENRTKVVAAIRKHAQVIESLRKKVA